MSELPKPSATSAPAAPAERSATAVGALRREAVARLRAAGVDTPELDARLLLEHALDIPAGGLTVRQSDPLDADAAARAWGLVERRAAREPVSRILGSRAFWTLDLALNAATLDPRPDTETVVEAALAALPDRIAPCRILDLGTGSGCILLALLAELPNALGVGLDRSAVAVAAARANARHSGLAGRAGFLVGDWSDALADGCFDLVVSNPPYIPSGDVAGLEPEVREHDPLAALDGGADGLDAYRALAPRLVRLLRPGGTAVLELGQGQAAAVSGLLLEAGLRVAGTRSDLGGVARALIAEKPHGIMA